MEKQTNRSIVMLVALVYSLCLTNIFAQTIGTSSAAYFTIVTHSSGAVYTWGHNNCGQLGNNSINTSYIPVAVNTENGTSALYGKTITQVAAGYNFSIALADDGTVYTWGENTYGELGNNSTDFSYVPVAVNTENGTSALYGKTIIQVAAGRNHSIALADDGTVYTWGNNEDGQLGNNSTIDSHVPVAVNTENGTSALYGKTIIQVAAGFYYCVALADDGTLYTWGDNNYGQLGNNSNADISVPVAVNTENGTSALYGKTITRVTAGAYHIIALADDGTVFTCGRNNHGQLGNNSNIDLTVPVAVNTEDGTSALYGKTITQVAAGYYHSIALASDSTVYTWGNDEYGQLGNNGTGDCLVPVAVNTESGISALYGKTVIQVAAGFGHSIALSSDGTVCTWGYNNLGQLGNNSVSNSLVPVAVYQDETGNLPVELASFTGTYTGTEVDLAWETETEVNNYGFNIERKSGSNGSWVKIGFVEGSGAENAGQSYTYADTTLPSVDTVSYRLKQLDNDGDYEYSKTIEVVISNSSVTGVEESNLPTEFGLSQNYPNPFNPTTSIEYQVPANSTVTIKVYDMLGREVTTLVNEDKTAGYYTATLNAGSLASGMYIYRMTAGDYVSVKKFVLLK